MFIFYSISYSKNIEKCLFSNCVNFLSKEINSHFYYISKHYVFVAILINLSG